MKWASVRTPELDTIVAFNKIECEPGTLTPLEVFDRIAAVMGMGEETIADYRNRNIAEWEQVKDDPEISRLFRADD